MFDTQDDWRYRISMMVPNSKFEIFVQLQSDPDAVKPKDRFCLKLKAIAKEPESDVEDEEEQSSEDELIHGSEVLGNEAGRW
jgi:hypothetical protein